MDSPQYQWFARFALTVDIVRSGLQFFRDNEDVEVVEMAKYAFKMLRVRGSYNYPGIHDDHVEVSSYMRRFVIESWIQSGFTTKEIVLRVHKGLSEMYQLDREDGVA